MVKPSKKALGKRKAPVNQSAASKKPKQELGPTGKPKRKPDQPKKVKLRDQKVIPIPRTEFDAQDNDDEGIMDMDLGEEEGLEIGGEASRFLTGLDRNALGRSARETKRLHELSKTKEPLPKPKRNKLKIPLPDSDNLSADDFDTDDEFPEDLLSDVDGSLGEPSGSGTDLDDEDLEGDGTSEDEEDDDQSDLNSAFDDVEGEESEEEEFIKRRKGKKDEEAEYETSGRSRWTAKPAKDKKDNEEHVEVGRLPIKLPTGEVQMVEGSTRIALPPSKKRPKLPEPESETEEEEEEEDEGSDDGAQAERMANQKGRFGRMNIAEIVGTPGWKNAQRLEAAKEQIAVIGAEILAGGELIDIAPTLTRLSTYALPTVPSPEEGQRALPVPSSIRGLALLSQLAVYKDLIPGYRIRQLTEAEETEKVRDEVRRLREGEKMLVRSYKGYLKLLEGEIKQKTPLASLSLKCMCDLLATVTHFNFSENIMGVLVGRLGRRSWDDDADLILQTFISVFRADLTAVHSQTLVRLLARMIKERKYQVHAKVLSCLLHLRLRTELDKMKDGKHSQKGKGKRDASGQQAIFKSDVRKKWQTKNQKKREKELKEVRKELAEAEAEVDKEERAQTQTETLKNLFVLYFSILKHPQRSPLLAAALEGISTFAHFINVDFFRDLLAVLRRIVQDDLYDDIDPDDPDANARDDPFGESERIRIRLLAIATAFDLLSGQGEALNIDLGDFINALFALLRPLSLDTGIEDPPYNPSSLPPAQKPIRPLQAGRPPPKAPVQVLSTSTLLFRCLHAVFFSRHTSSATAPPWRTSAFAKRLAEVALLLPPNTARQAVDFVRALMARDNKLEALLDSEERMFDGVYKAELDDPQLVNAFATSLYEVDVLGGRYWDRGVREVAAKLRDGKIV
ncbi:CBF/Mak21 family-domain-containing protein [Naematelia encephala]|uniref:Nucleolar complex-associated protein 3 n=1 Tax=Naematelia encephala TaxID=71784 RepID=A0A1Y2BH65_9TREE|nr:CBF/Mak21 family-domain-containing protein [Naematelia encephala]